MAPTTHAIAARRQHRLQAFSGRESPAQAHEAMIYGVELILGGDCHDRFPQSPALGQAALGRHHLTDNNKADHLLRSEMIGFPGFHSGTGI
jgi:hypothetical protein